MNSIQLINKTANDVSSYSTSCHSVFYSRMLSGMGRNAQFYCERFGTSLYDALQ